MVNLQLKVHEEFLDVTATLASFSPTHGSQMRIETCPVSTSNPPLGTNLRSHVWLCPRVDVLLRQLGTDVKQLQKAPAPSQAGLWLQQHPWH